MSYIAFLKIFDITYIENLLGSICDVSNSTLSYCCCSIYIYIIDLSVFNLLQLIMLLHLLVFQFFLCSYKSDFNNNIYTIKILVYQEKWEYFIR